MAVDNSVDPAGWLAEQIGVCEPDVLRSMVKTMAEALMSAEADAVCGADYGTRSEDRVNRRNGYRVRDWDTRAGTVELAIPKLRSGSYFPEWLLERRRRAEQALVSVVATSYLLGVSTRRVDKLVEQMGIKGISKSQVSEMSKVLDAQVAAFRNRPLESGPYAFVWVDALTQKVREGGRIVNVHVLVATGVNADGHREILGVEVTSAEDGAGWLAFLRGLVARGLSGVQMVISDAHRGLVEAIGSTLPGAGWQRCRTHYLRNLLTRVPKSAQPWVATLVRTIFDQPAAEEVHAQHARVVASLEAKHPDAAEHLDQARPDLLAFTGFPRQLWRQIWSNNPQERLNKEIRRRTDVVGIFPDRAAIVRLVGAVLMEQTDEWTEARRYMGPECLAKARLRVIDGTTPDPATEQQELTA
ncbi:IS256 family transposase [Actinomadura sp. NAK00032]|uniref:IS256 family transposase n=1 Tax=Actinomadura sp. NAK00032 TaxID=2742128 RepID=UPI001591D95D|nr:IS256 family transposase [Actinomadura sp. NAK00032]QKW33685.1 IS256 family transposase [Actinomadura sp. NAK00032]QKW37069.1 IS256 family transposase [Actinomadura sp. NAK00032]QKW38170.1 IS256 family transposase [Actinomadura sp. NAK00032]